MFVLFLSLSPRGDRIDHLKERRVVLAVVGEERSAEPEQLIVRRGIGIFIIIIFIISVFVPGHDVRRDVPEWRGSSRTAASVITKERKIKKESQSINQSNNQTIKQSNKQ